MANSIIDRICNSCSCNRGQAEEYLNDEISILCELAGLGDLRYGDFEVSCENLGLDYDDIEYLVNIMASSTINQLPLNL